MDRLPLIISEFTGAAGRLGGMAAHVLRDRLELMALEVREAKIRFVQELFLAFACMAFPLLGLLLLVLAGVSSLAPEWRIYGLAAAAGAFMLVGVAAFVGLRRRLVRNPTAFGQSLAELKKDMACFSTKN